MRKLFWCCSAAGVLVVGGMFSASYYASQNPNSVMGCCLTTAANTSIVIQPVLGVGTVVARATHHVMKPNETACPTGSIEECVPADPQPIAMENAPEPAHAAVAEKAPVHGPAPIVIPEDDPMPREEALAKEWAELANTPPPPWDPTPNEPPCPVVMPYCTDDDDPMLKPRMPYADGEKNTIAEEESEDGDMKAWKEFFKGDGAEKKPASPEESRAPAEKPTSEPKCQEDSHMHEHYPGCPSTTGPATGKSRSSATPVKKAGKPPEHFYKQIWDAEELSEEPPSPSKEYDKKSAPGKGCEGKNSCPHTQGVDTMEYRRSDGGLNEYGRGPF